MRVFFSLIAAVLIGLFFIPKSHAQKTFSVCRGSDIAGCDIKLPAGDYFVGCSDPNIAIESVCPARLGARTVKQISSRDGGQCGYNVWSVQCNPEIAPAAVLNVLGISLSALFALVGAAAGFWGARVYSVKGQELYSPWQRIGTWVTGITGLLGLIIAAISIYFKFNSASPNFQKLGLLDWLIPSAYANDDPLPVVTMIKLSIGAFVLALIGAAFLMSLIALFRLEDTKANQGRIKSADNIVKMFGGFLTGLATALLTKI
ncbi:hypothetical protein ACQR1Y_11560 [Bradyrhizobium sp. HKCCYLRH3099]|uniref:hypothetical protein n=1 Tax=unclassified Bradyrhizobium TaxID=2631580 RepID=UPI003EB70B75